jgi:glucose/arabinose dehydrogenase
MNYGIRSGASATALLVATLGFATGNAAHAQSACKGDNGGLTLSPGFCATIFADNLGHTRQMAVAPNGVLYVNTWTGVYYNNDTPHDGGLVVALQGTKGDGKADKIERFGPTFADGDKGGTGLAIYKNYLYVETNDAIARDPLPTQGIAPSGKPETIVSGLPITDDHPMHPFGINAKGNMYVDLGSASNACQAENRMPEVPGANPCKELETRGGTWLYDANKLDQHFSRAERFATGIRNGEGFSFDSAGRVYVTQHGRDQLSQNWPKLYHDKEGENPAGGGTGSIAARSGLRLAGMLL